MKIGQITWWRNNYGSVLQAYALQKKLEDIGYPDCEIICQYGKKVTSFNNLKDKIKTIGLKNTIKRIIGKYFLRKLRIRTKKIEKFVNENLKISEKEYTEENIKSANEVYDTFICGSDQIWNPSLTSLDSIYWLTFVDENKTKISYAPSVGIDKFELKYEQKIKENLSTFKAISCREETGTIALNTVIKNKCKTVLDPTLIIEKKYWDKMSEKKLTSEKYIFVYLLRGTKKQRKIIEKLSKEKNLKIVTIPFLDSEYINIYDFKFGNIKIWDATPSDFISLIRHSEYVVTDSFHCMLFSTIYHKNFFVFPKKGKNQQNRLINFLKMISEEDRMIQDEELLSCVKNTESTNWNKIDKIIEKNKKNSEKYLIDALKR